MVALPAHQVARFLAKPDPRTRVILLHGPDAGLVAERSSQLASRLANGESPPGEIIRLDDADLETDPDRLGIELLTAPMFGGAKIVRASAGRRVNAAVRSLLGEAPFAGALIVEAGELRRDDALRTAFEKHPGAVAIACYPDEGASLDDLVSEVLDRAELEIAADARLELVSRLGADRALSRSEIEKLALYAHGASRIEVAHVEAIVGDVAAQAVDRIVSAACGGDTARALSECDRAVAAGESPQGIVLALERRVQALHRLRTGADAGRPIDDAIRTMRPPLPPRIRAELDRQVRLWTAATIQLALARITEAVRRSRTAGADEAVIADRLVIEIARLARSHSPRTR